MTKRAEGHACAMPFHDPWDSLTPGAKKIVAAPAELLGKESYDALSYERIAEKPASTSPLFATTSAASPALWQLLLTQWSMTLR